MALPRDVSLFLDDVRTESASRLAQLPRDILFYCLGPYLDTWNDCSEKLSFQLSRNNNQIEGRITVYSTVHEELNVDRNQFRETYLPRAWVFQDEWRINWVTNLDDKTSKLDFLYHDKKINSIDLPHIAHGTLSLCDDWFYLKLDTSLYLINLTTVTQLTDLPPVLELPIEYQKCRVFLHPTTGEIFGAQDNQIFRFHPRTRRMMTYDIRLPPANNPHLKINGNLHNALMSFNRGGRLELTFWLTVYTMV